MDFFKIQRTLESAETALPAAIKHVEAFRAELAAHHQLLAEHNVNMLRVLAHLELVSQRQTEIELQLMGIRGATQR